MVITPKLEIRQSQSLLMTPQLRQAINLLPMSNLELSQLVEKELENNPLLEREDVDSKVDENTPQTIDDYQDLSTPVVEDFKPDVDYDNQFDDSGSDREGYDSLDNDYSWSDYNQSKEHGDDNDFDYFEKKLADNKSLYRFLNEQIGLRFRSQLEQAVAQRLVEFLDEAGYFRGDIKTIATRLGLPVTKIQNILEAMKGFEPSGIFAISLAECLKIQLQDINRFDPAMQKLLDNLPLLAERKFKELKKICEVDEEDLSDMINDIKKLNPKPAAEYNHDLTTYVIPDVFVRTNKEGNYIVELNNMSLPRVLINRHYYSEIKKNADDKETKHYLKEQISSANFLVKALNQRANTILKVSEEIVKAQRSFLEKGIQYLKPMSLKNVAENIEMHESTVSRVTTNKYMHTPRGLFELKYFFSNAAGTYSGDDQTSTLSIKHQIKKFIDREEIENILSDDKLVEVLAATGIKIARRTVTKYREAMGIATSSQRKRDKRTQM